MALNIKDDNFEAIVAEGTILEENDKNGGQTMAYTDDWENLMNGVFGAGGKPRFGGTAQPESKTPKAKAPAVPDLNAALLENQKQLDALLKKQNAQLKTQDTAVQSALEDSRQMLRDMEAFRPACRVPC